jgi:hypothetical protein
MKRIALALLLVGFACFDLGDPTTPDNSFPIGDGEGEIDPSGSPRFIDLQNAWVEAGCSSAGQCHDLDERTIVVKINPDEVRLLENWSQIAPPEAGGEGVNAAGSVNHFASRPSFPLWQAWQAAGYPYVE